MNSLTFDLTGRVALVTGASSGLGAGFCRLLAASGAKVVLGARRTDLITRIASDIGEAALAVPVDVTDEASVIAAYDAAEARFGTVDTVIANAGVDGNGKAVDMPVELFRQTVDINLTGAFLTAREGAKRMMAAKVSNGRVLLISSITAQESSGGMAPYAASKAGIRQLTRTLAREWANRGINVNAIAPGYILTEINADWFETPGGEAQKQAFTRRRLMPQDGLDTAMLYFCSDASAYVTGSELTMDDGQLL
jgi:NAD(P)-dependent dehydrogenase (short-subunit alcohol dehydrogenase family)